MSETRKVDQFKTYTLYANVVKVLGKKDGKEVTRNDRVPFAVFDDKKLLSAYTKNSTYKLKGQKSWEVVEDWVEIKPVAGNFSLPFNPEPSNDDNAKDNGNN